MAVVLTSTFLFGCQSADSVDDADELRVSNTAQGIDDGSATAQGLGDGAAIDAETLEAEAAAAAAMMTVYYFEFDQAGLSDDARANLAIVAPALAKSGESIRIEGHADELGTREYNLALGERRANAISSYLQVQGVNAAQLEMISYGEEKPVATGSGDADRAQNRRVELIK